jgi:hypothetical protein
MLALALTLPLAPPAPAATVMAPVHAAPTTTGGAHAPGLLIDQSGLSTGYTPGVTDFDAYLAGGPTHTAGGTNGWRSQTPDNSPWVWLELSGPTVLDALALWVDGAAPPAFMDVIAEIDGVGYVPLAEDVALGAPALGNPVPAQRVDWAAVTTSRLLLQLSCRPNDAACGLGEVILRSPANTVPEPAVPALLAAAVTALVAQRRRRTGAAR